MLLGFIVNKNDAHVDPEKIKAIQEWPTPQNVGDVRSFHGLPSIYRLFIFALLMWNLRKHPWIVGGQGSPRSSGSLGGA